MGTGELSGKRVALLNASARGVYAQASLREVLKTMDARLLDEAEVSIDLMGKRLTAEEIAGNAEWAGGLRRFLQLIKAG